MINRFEALHRNRPRIALALNTAGTWLALRILLWTFGLDALSILDVGLGYIVLIGVIWILVDTVWLNPRLGEHTDQTFPVLPVLGIRGGYVYLLQGQKGYYKIGHTKDPSDRYQTFKLKLPFAVEYLHLITCDDRRAAESMLHRCFAHRRIKGTEWFLLTEDDIRLIKSIQHI